MKSNLECLLKIIKKEKNAVDKKRNVNYKKIEKMIDSYSKIIMNVEKENISIIPELGIINIQLINKYDDISILNKFVQLIKEKYDLLILFLNNKLLEFNVYHTDNTYRENSEYKNNKINYYQKQINELTEDKENILFALDEENQNIIEFKNEINNLEDLINNKDELNEENIDIETVIKEMKYYEKQLKQSEEAKILLSVDILICDIKIKSIQFKLLSIDN